MAAIRATNLAAVSNALDLNKYISSPAISQDPQPGAEYGVWKGSYRRAIRPR